MPANKRIGWTLPASETVEGAPSDLTLEQWARAEKDAGRGPETMRLLGVSNATFYARLKHVQPQAAAPQRTEDEPCAGCKHDGSPLTDEPCHSCSALDPDETADHYELATQPGAETKAPVRETKQRPRGTGKPKPAAPAPVASRSLPQVPPPAPEPAPAATGEPLEDDSDAGLPLEKAVEPSPPVEAEFRLEPVVTVEGLLAFLRDEDLSHEAELFCRGYNAGRREVA